MAHGADSGQSAETPAAELPPSPVPPPQPRETHGAQEGGGVAPFGGAFSGGTLALVMTLVGIPALFFESLLLAVSRGPSAFGARLERPG
jgi:hypothetical protein